MEFTPSLTAFQGVLIAADSTHSFSTLTSKGGNESEILYIVDSIKDFLCKENHIVGNKIHLNSINILRKFAFYIVINSDLNILKDLVDFDGLEYVIWTLPTIPKYLMCEILWQLRMDKFIYEIIVFSCPKFAIEVADAVLENFKYLNPTDSLLKIKLLTSACYRMIHRLVYFKMDLNMLTQAFRNFENCLRYFRELPNAIKLKTLQGDEKYEFMGKQFYYMLCVIVQCMDNYCLNKKFKSPDFQEIYELTYGQGAVVNEDSSVISTNKYKELLEILDKSNIALLDTCKHLAMDINVNVFCAWSEFEFDNEKSMQKVIGVLTYKILCIICRIPKLKKHPVLNILKEIAYKPVDFAEIINVISADDIIHKIGNDKERPKWIKALLYREKLFEDIALVELIDTHLELFDSDECHRLFKTMYEYLKLNVATENEEKKLLASKIFQRCSSLAKNGIIEIHFSKNIFIDTLETSEFDSMVTEIFNKLINTPNVDMSKVFNVFIQNPRKVFTKIITVACEGMEQTNVMIAVIKPLEKYFNHYYEKDIEPCIMLVLKDVIASILECETKQHHFIRFLTSLKNSGAIPGPKLLLLVIMPNLHKALLNKNIFDVDLHCKLIQECYPLRELADYRPPILAMFAQVLDTVRWKMDTYSPIAPVTLERVIKLQTMILMSYESHVPAKDSRWLRCKIRNINPLNMYYYRYLWDPPGNTFAEVISGIRIHKNMDKENLTLWLSKVLCCTTLHEWCLIWESMQEFGNGQLLDLFHDALLLLFVAEKSIHTETSKSCLMFCMQNFVCTVRYQFLKESVTENQVTAVFNKFILTERLIEEHDLDDFAVTFIPLLSYIAEAKPDISIEIVQKTKDKLKYKELFSIFYDMFIMKRKN